MKRPSSASMPLPIALALVASVVALGALWVAPVVGLALFGLVVLAGLVLLVRGSRFWGPVPTSAIVGIVRLRYWPLGKLGTL